MNGEKDCYSESDILVNKYNIHDKELLERFEIQKVFAKLLGLDVKPTRIAYTYDVEHLIAIHQYLFGNIYEWAGLFRKENLYKSERVLSGGSAEYADYHDIQRKLEEKLQKYGNVKWKENHEISNVVTDFLLDLWSVHPFREGNTRTCITFLWHYLKGKDINFQVSLLRNNPMYVRDSLVMANYDQKEYLRRIISDTLQDETEKIDYMISNEQATDQYQIAKSDYETFRERYSIKNK